MAKAEYLKPHETAGLALPDTNQNVKVPPNWMQVLRGYRGQSTGRRRPPVEATVGRCSVVNQVKQMRVWKSLSPFNRRMTAVTWHPHEPNVCAVGSKGGGV